MPTKKKRVGFIPRDEVMRIIDQLSMVNNLSNSKIINILVEEALSARGIFINKNKSATSSYQKIGDESHDLFEDYTDFNDNEKFKINAKLGTKSNHEAFDLQTYKKFLSFLKFQEMLEKYQN